MKTAKTVSLTAIVEQASTQAQEEETRVMILHRDPTYYDAIEAEIAHYRSLLDGNLERYLSTHVDGIGSRIDADYTYDNLQASWVTRMQLSYDGQAEFLTQLQAKLVSFGVPLNDSLSDLYTARTGLEPINLS